MNNDMQVDASGSGPMALDDGGWKFAQCFGEKNEVEDVSEGKSLHLSALKMEPNSYLRRIRFAERR